MRCEAKNLTWDGLPLTVCPVCGYAAADEVQFAEHERESGHDDLAQLQPVSELSHTKRKTKSDVDMAAETRIDEVDE